jgi:hypothetical protein
MWVISPCVIEQARPVPEGPIRPPWGDICMEHLHVSCSLLETKRMAADCL